MYLSRFNLAIIALMSSPALAFAATPDQVLGRWLHVLGGAILLGSAIFTRFALIPAASSALSDDAHEKLRAALRSRWSKLLGAVIGIVLLSGFYNYLVYGIPAHKGQALYHAVLGTKIILAFVVFFLASILVGRTSLAQKFQAKSSTWLLVTIGLGIVIFAMGAFLRFIPTV